MMRIFGFGMILVNTVFASGYSQILLRCQSRLDSDIYVSCKSSTAAPGGPISVVYTWGKADGTMIGRSNMPFQPDPTQYSCVTVSTIQRCPISGSP